MVDGDETGRGSLPPGVAVAFATVAYLALFILGLGLVSLSADTDVIIAPGLNQLPGIIGTTLSLVVFAGSLWSSVRRRHPSFFDSVWIAASALLAYLLGLWVTAIASGAGIGVATGVAGRIVVGTWFGAVIAGAAFVSAWGGIALVRTRAGRPRWPWEDEDE